MSLDARDPGHFGEPHWLRDAGALWAYELRRFTTTAAAFLRHPNAFGADWTSGRLDVMNPLGFLGVSWPLLLPIDYGLQRLMGWDRRENLSFFIEAARTLRPYLLLVPAALLVHV